MALEKVLTPEFRVGFPHVFKPKVFGQGDPKFSVMMIFEKKADLAAMKRIAMQAAKEKWGDKLPPNFRGPLRDGAEKAHLEGLGTGVVFTTATTKTQPGLVDRELQTIVSPSEFYPGCYARATVHAFAYDNSGNRGVSFGLQNLQKLRDGKPLSGRSRPEDDFDALGDEDEVAAPRSESTDPMFA